MLLYSGKARLKLEICQAAGAYIVGPPLPLQDAADLRSTPDELQQGHNAVAPARGLSASPQYFDAKVVASQCHSAGCTPQQLGDPHNSGTAQQLQEQTYLKYCVPAVEPAASVLCRTGEARWRVANGCGNGFSNKTGGF